MSRRHHKIAGRPSLKYKNNLKQLRRERGWTQLYVSQQLGIPRGTYSPMESGTVFPNEELIYKLQDLFQVSYERIFPDD